MKKLLLSLCMIGVATTASAADFVDTESADNIIDFGVRVGITSSNLSTDIPGQGDNCTYSWKSGFSTGVVLDRHGAHSSHGIQRAGACRLPL